jgi:hypothetical protein
VKKVGQKEGRTIQIGNARLTWKATGEDTGYAAALYEMDLKPGVGIPVHSHPYAEIFYVISGHTDFLRIDVSSILKCLSPCPFDGFNPFVKIHRWAGRGVCDC